MTTRVSTGTTLGRLALIFVPALVMVCALPLCQQKTQDAERAPDPLTTGGQSKDKDEVPLFKRTRHLMGTMIGISVAGENEQKAGPAVEAALAEIARLEGLLSEWQPTSEISEINAAAGSHPVGVGADTMTVIKAGLEISKWSDGAFDLSWAALRGLYAFKPGQQRVPDQDEIRRRLPLINYRDIVVDEEANTVMLRRKGMQIGLGGIAKGLALDHATDILRKAGIENFMMFGGGQVQIHGKRGNRAWRVGIRHPRRLDYFAQLETSEGSLATSGDYERAFVAKGKRWHHILDPRDGLPVEHTVSVTVLSKTGLYADALSTALFVLGAERALQMLPTAPGHPEAVIVDKDFKMYASPSVKKRLLMRVPLDQGRIPL